MRLVKAFHSILFYTSTFKRSSVALALLTGTTVHPADVPPVPAGRDQSAEPLRPLHGAGGEAAEERGVVAGAEPAGPLHQLQTRAVQLPET